MNIAVKTIIQPWSVCEEMRILLANVRERFTRFLGELFIQVDFDEFHRIIFYTVKSFSGIVSTNMRTIEFMINVCDIY